MARVDRAIKRGVAGFERLCAIKRMLPHLSAKRRFVIAFIREARLAATLRHPNIRATFDLGEVNGEFYIDMEFIDGVDLNRLIRQARRASGPPPNAMTVFFLSQLCDALHYIHNWRGALDQASRGILHRDISPANVMISNSGHLKVIDFGIAESEGSARRDLSTEVRGKIGYLAPEAFKGEGLDVRSDLFSLGIIAHELLTTRRLFRPRSDLVSIRLIHQRNLPKPSEFNPAVPPSLDAWVMKALEPQPEDRWPSASSMRTALASVADDVGGMYSCGEVADWVQKLFATPSGRLARRSSSVPPGVVQREVPHAENESESVVTAITTAVDSPTVVDTAIFDENKTKVMDPDEQSALRTEAKPREHSTNVIERGPAPKREPTRELPVTIAEEGAVNYPRARAPSPTGKPAPLRGGATRVPESTEEQGAWLVVAVVAVSIVIALLVAWHKSLI